MDKTQIFNYLKLLSSSRITDPIQDEVLEMLFGARFIAGDYKEPNLTYLGYSATLISPDNCILLLQQALLQRNISRHH